MTRLPSASGLPSLRNGLRELAAFPKVVLNPLRRPLKGTPIAQGQPVLVIPGLLTGDISTSFLRRSLNARGFDAHGWSLGINTGADAAKVQRLATRLAQLHSASGQKVVVIGWSLGGLYARLLGHRAAEHVAQVVTVASPFSGDRRANRAWRLYELINDHRVDNPPFAEDLSAKPPVPTVAVWSPLDGVVSPACTCGLEAESDLRVEVRGQHFELGASRRCVAALIEVLERQARTSIN